MVLDEMIKRYKNNAEYELTHGNLQGYLEFTQLVEWLTDYKQLLEQAYVRTLKSVMNAATIWYCPECGAKMEVMNNV